MNRKNPKGSVAITIDQGRLRLRWTWEGKRYSLNHSFNSPVNLLAAKKWSSRCKPPAKQAIGMWMICYTVRKKVVYFVNRVISDLL